MNTQTNVTIDDAGIAVLTLNRPDAANAMSVQLLKEVMASLVDLKFNPFIRTIIITGTGEKAFCAGADLKERAGMDDVQVRKTVSLIRDVVTEIENFPQPVIAAINGAAFGGGLELALACDLRIASDHAKLGLTETSLGIIPGAGGTQRLARLIGKGRAKELIFTAKKLTAKEAEAINLVESVVPFSELMSKCFQIANEIAKNAPIAIEQAKVSINKGLDVDLATGLKIEQLAYERTIPTEDRLEGLQAFKEKRMPVYKGK